MVTSKSKIRLFVAPGLVKGARFELGESQAHYLTHVMRARPGQEILVFNGRDGEWRAIAGETSKKTRAVEVADQTRAQEPDLGPWLAFAPLKKSPMDFIAAKATELGVSRLMAVFTENTAVGRVNTARLTANAVEAAEQCRRLTVPEVAEPVPLERLIDEWPRQRMLLVGDQTGETNPIYEALSGFRERRGAPQCGFMVGPEGGFTDPELDALYKLPFASLVGLGRRVLRAETAALSMLACWQAIVDSPR